MAMQKHMYATTVFPLISGFRPAIEILTEKYGQELTLDYCCEILVGYVVYLLLQCIFLMLAIAISNLSC